MREGKYINKSLFFLTQVINRKITGESSAHVPYRNAALTKILKSSLCGNTKTCVILCLSPSKSQFDHSLQTLKFGLSVSKIETRAERNISKASPEEALKFLIQEYQSRLASLKKQTQSSSGDEELRAENKMLWEQLTSSKESKTLLQFYIENPLEMSIGCLNEPKSNSNVIRTCIEALKVSCKHSSYWKAEAQAYEKAILQLNQEMIKRNNYLVKLVEVVEDYFKMIKSQAAKLEIYECTEKWVQQLTIKDLNALVAHFKRKLEQIQSLIPKTKKSNKAPPKLELKLKYNEQYTFNLLKEAKELSESNVMKLEEIDKKACNYNVNDKNIIDLIQAIKEMLASTPLKENECPSTPNIHYRKHELNASPKCAAPRTPNARKNIRQRSPLRVEIRSRSNKAQGKTYNEMAKLNTMISQAVKISSTPKESLTGFLQSDKGSIGSYGIGIFSHMHSLKQLKRSARRQNKEGIVDSKSQKEIQCMANAPIQNENSKVLQSWHKDNIEVN